MSTVPARSLADQLRAWPDDRLARLLQERPDLGSPAPQDSAQLASRAATRASLLRALDRPALASWEQLALRLTLQLAQLGEPDPGAAGQLEEIVLSADAAGLSWLSRVARGLQAVQLLMTDPAPWRVATCADLVRDC